MEQEFEIEKDWIGLEIHPETPLEGRDMNELYPLEMRQQLYNRLNKVGKDYGISFKSGNRLANTHMALVLTEYAKETGKFNILHKKLFQAYFEEGKDIGNRQVLLQIAEKADLSRNEVENAWLNPVFEERLKKISASALKEAATGVPTFIVNDKYRIVGAQPYEEFQKVLQKARGEKKCAHLPLI